MDVLLSSKTARWSATLWNRMKTRIPRYSFFTQWHKNTVVMFQDAEKKSKKCSSDICTDKHGKELHRQNDRTEI